MTLTPDYLTYWTLIGLIVLGWPCLWTWLMCGFVVIGGMHTKTGTLKRVLIALVLGPLLLRNSGFSR